MDQLFKVNLVNMLRLLVIACFVIIAKGQATNTTNVNRCASNQGDLPLHVYIEGCIDPPCQVVQGGYAVVNVVFKVPRTLRRMKTQAIAMKLNYPLGENAITCNFLKNTYCPVLKDEVVMYTLRMRIETLFPPVSVGIFFSVVDENDNPIWCFSTVVQVVRPSRKGISFENHDEFDKRRDK